MSADIVNRSPINIGIAGIGHMGKYHVNLLVQIFPSDNIFIYDIDENAINLIKETQHVNYCKTYQEMLNSVEAVVVVVPTYLHYEYTMKALEAGCHVLVEKPISNNLKHAQEMMSHARENDLILHIGHVERFNGAIQEMRNLIDNPHYFQAQRIGAVSRIQDVGVVLDLMIHDIDIILSLVNSDVKEVAAYGESIITKFEDYALATLYFENGVVASLIASRVSSHKARNMIVSQDRNYIHLDYASHDLVVYRNQGSQYNISPGQIKYKEEHIVDRIFVHKDNPLKTELEYFVDAIAGNINNVKYENVVWDSHSNLYTMEIAFQILEEIERNRKSK